MDRVLLLGHSFVHRLDTFMKATDLVNFEFDESKNYLSTVWYRRAENCSFVVDQNIG